MLPINENKIKKQIKKKLRRKQINLVLLNEEELIRQVRMRPILYDRSLRGYRKMSLRKQYWSEISKALDSAEEECRKRWRSLRDCFSKRCKAAQRLSDAGVNKQQKWMFYDQMSFLTPHLDGGSYDFDKILDEFGDISEDAQSLNSEPSNPNAASEELDNIKKDIEEHKAEEPDILQHSSTVSMHPTEFVQIPIVNSRQSPMDINDNNSETNMASTTRPYNRTCNNLNTSASNTLCGETTGESGIPLNSDERFLLSCAPTLSRLTHRQNALARLKIQQMLFEIEFDQKDL